MRSDTVSHQIADNTVSEAFCIGLDCGRDIIEMIASFRELNPLKERLPGNINQLLRFRADGTNRVGSCSIRMIAFVNDACIQADNVAFLDDMVLIRNTMYNLIIHRNTDGCRVAIVILKGRNTPELADQLLAQTVNVQSGHARVNGFLQFLMYLRQNSSGLPHQLNLSCGFDRY